MSEPKEVIELKEEDPEAWQKHLESGLEWLRDEIMKEYPMFFNDLENPECPINGWDLIAYYVKLGRASEDGLLTAEEIKERRIFKTPSHKQMTTAANDRSIICKIGQLFWGNDKQCYSADAVLRKVIELMQKE